MGKQILLLGIGQTGCNVSEAFLNGMQSDSVSTHAFAVDTDVRAFADVELSHRVPMISDGSLADAVERLGDDWVRELFPCDWERDGTEFARRLSMSTGANLWRAKSLISFFDFLTAKKPLERFHAELNAIAELSGEDGIELHVVASAVGGTGSGLFLPLTLYVKQYLKGLGARILSTDCILVMPEIYENTLSAEQRVKAHANAYAALCELNAVNLAALGDDGKQHPPIDLRIGHEKAACGILFDTEKDKFRDPARAPFDKVIIFERAPGVNSVSAHISIISDLLISVCKYMEGFEEDNNTTEKTSNAIYEGIALTKVRYAPDCITKYISKLQTEAALNREITALHKDAKADMKKRSIEARSLRSREDVDEIEQYCDSFIHRAKAQIEDVGCADALLGRVTELPADAEPAAPWTDDFAGDVRSRMNKLCDLMDATLDCDELDSLVEIVQSEEKPKEQDPKKKEKPLPAKERRARLLAHAAETEAMLEALVAKLEEMLHRGADAFADALLAPDGELSALAVALTPDGKALHPGFALLRLCLVYKYLKRRTVCERPALVEMLGAGEKLSTIALMVDEAGFESKYAKAGKKRFIALLSDNIPDDPDLILHKSRSNKKYLLNDGDRVFKFVTLEEMHQKLADDDQQFMSDLEQVYTRIRDAARCIRYTQALAAVGSLIEKYRRLADSLATRLADMAVDVKLAAINGGADTSLLINVATGETEKKTVYGEYAALYSQDTAAVGADDEALGRIFLDAVSGNKGADAVIEKVEQLYAARFEGSRYYEEKLQKNVLIAALDSMNGTFGDSGLSFGRIFRERFSPLRIIRDGDHPERRNVKNTTTAIFSKGVWDTVAEHPDRFDGCEPRDFFERKMYDAGEYRGVATFSDRIDDGEFWIRRRTSNVFPHLFETFNETSREATAYNAYKKAKATAALRSTAMWIPDLIFRRDGMPLPMISPVARENYEHAVAKAVLYGLISGEIYLAKHEELGEIYFAYVDGESTPVTVNGKAVGEKQAKELFSFAYSHPAMTERAAAEYTALFEERYSLGAHFANHKEFAAAIAKSDRMTKLYETFSTLLIRFYSAKSLEVSGFADALAGAVRSSVLTIAKNGSAQLDEKTGLVYNALVDGLMTKLIKTAKGERAKTLVKWLNDGACLLKFEPPLEFKNYEI